MAVLEGGNTGGYKAGVTAAGELCTFSVNISRELDSSRAGYRFGTGTGPIALPAGFNGEGLWFRNDNNDLNFHVTKIIVGWNGGDTNHNRTLTYKSLRNSGTPTANAAIVTPNNTNYGSTREAEATAYKWDGVGTTGMTTVSGDIVATRIIGQGGATIDIDGLIISPNSVLSTSLAPEEAGTASISILGYYDVVGGI